MMLIIANAWPLTSISIRFTRLSCPRLMVLLAGWAGMRESTGERLQQRRMALDTATARGTYHLFASLWCGKLRSVELHLEYDVRAPCTLSACSRMTFPSSS